MGPIDLLDLALDPGLRRNDVPVQFGLAGAVAAHTVDVHAGGQHLGRDDRRCLGAAPAQHRRAARRETILAEAQKVGFKAPIMMDVNQLVGGSLGVNRSAEAYVINPKTWTVFYRGPVSGAAAAVDALMSGNPAPASVITANGAQIAFPDRGMGAKISYAKDVAPILEAKCVACHQEGGIGPFAMNSYAMVKGFSPMIREVI
eukprot:gene38878-52515_t